MTDTREGEGSGLHPDPVVMSIDEEVKTIMTELRATELAREEAVLLPSREALALFNINVAVPVNTALALNALTEGSTAAANAAQLLAIGQQ